MRPATAIRGTGWERFRVLLPTSDSTSESLELARIVTPYDITGGGGPGTCGWEFDMTDYGFLLRDSVTLCKLYRNLDQRHARLAGDGHVPLHRRECRRRSRTASCRLWHESHLVYGDPERPVDIALGDTTVERGGWRRIR